MFREPTHPRCAYVNNHHFPCEKRFLSTLPASQYRLKDVLRSLVDPGKNCRRADSDNQTGKDDDRSLNPHLGTRRAKRELKRNGEEKYG